MIETLESVPVLFPYATWPMLGLLLFTALWLWRGWPMSGEWHKNRGHRWYWPANLPFLAARACWRWWKKGQPDPGRQGDGEGRGVTQLDRRVARTSVVAGSSPAITPTPYASKLPSGTGSAPEAPWAALEAHRDLEARVTALENRHIALEAKRGAWRGYRWHCGCEFLFPANVWRICNPGPGQPRVWRDNNDFPENEMLGGAGKRLHGPELDALVAEFEAWEKPPSNPPRPM